MTPEHKLMNDIRLAISDKCINFRINVGAGQTRDGRYFTTGVPPGFPDIFGVRKSDGKAVFIEVKTKSGRISPKQANFIKNIKKFGAIAGVCRTPEEAIKLIEEDL